MTVMPNAPTNATQAPRWLRVATGCLLFLALWVAFVLAFGSTMPLARSGALAPALWLSASALPASLAAWLMVRRASARLLAPLAVIVLVGIGGFAGAVGGMLIATATGYMLQRTASYVPIFFIAGSAYLFALLLIHLLTPQLEPARLEKVAG